jgi:hypothetical protein
MPKTTYKNQADCQAAFTFESWSASRLNRSKLGAFGALRELRAGALLIGADPFFNSESQLLSTLTRRHAIPTAYQYREFAAAGGLMSYGGSLTDSYRQLCRANPNGRQAGRPPKSN